MSFISKYHQFSTIFSIGAFFTTWAYLVANFGFIFGLVVGFFVALVAANLLWSVLESPFWLVRRFKK